MDDKNPYSAPDSEVVDSNPGGFQLHDPRRVPASNGWAWISEGFAHFTQSPGVWILICIVGFVIAMLLSINSTVSMLAQATASIWAGGLMLGCRAQDEGKSISVGHLFACFAYKAGPLLLVTIITSVLSFLIFAAVTNGDIIQIYAASLNGEDPVKAFQEMGDIRSFLIKILVALLFIMPVIAMSWFAPALIVLNNVSLGQALTMSLKGCFINFWPMAIYGLVLLVFFILGALPLGLGLLIVMPMFYGSLYRSYKDIYIN